MRLAFLSAHHTTRLLLIGLALVVAPLHGQQTDSVFVGSTICGWYVVPDSALGQTVGCSVTGAPRSDGVWSHSVVRTFRRWRVVQPTPVPPVTTPSLIFASAWGAGDPMDGGKWRLRIGNGRSNRVVPVGDSLNFPTVNVLKVVGSWRGSPAGAAAENQRIDNLPDLQVGQSRGYRWYIRVIVPESYTGDTQTHPIQDATNGGGTNWMFQVFADQRVITSGPDSGRVVRNEWSASWSVRGAWPNNRFICAERLERHRTYRVEMLLTRLPNGLTLAARLYDGDRLACSETQFQNVNRTGNLGTNPLLGIHDATQFRSLQVGFNGLNGGTEGMYPVPLYYQGGVAVCVSWCGEYRKGER